ncbi:hypothetical protein BH20ACT5_BH20ACT5_16980 [soil metagenome]
MFSSLGWAEILMLLLVALFIFGPDRLPGIAQDAAGALKKVREFVTGAREQIGAELGEDFKDLRLTTLNPREFVRRQLLDDDPEPLIKRSRSNGATSPAPRQAPAPAPPVRAEGERPPYDTDAT